MYLWFTDNRDPYRKRPAYVEIEWQRGKFADEFMSVAIRTTLRSADDLAAPADSFGISVISGQAHEVMVCG